ncbi:MAG TPA: hypothetical protein VMT64_08650, partial [Candidatus Binataceae bacterium]|nr:hypothetical protein [Candidatus Binataceae bacterium]
PGLLRTVPGGSRRSIFWSASRAGVATVFDPALSLMRFLPATLEWNIFAVILVLASLALHITAIPALAMLALGPIWALYYAWHAPIEKCHLSFRARMLVAYLAYIGPHVRTITRYKTLANAQKNLGAETAARQRPTIQWLKRTVRLAYWNETWTPRDVLLERLTKFFAKSGHPAMIESGWRDYDLEVRPSPFTTIEIKTADEEHEQGKLKNHVAARIRMSRLSAIALAIGTVSAAATAMLAMPILAVGLAGLTLVFAVCVLAAMAESGRLVYRAVEECAAELNLFPLGKLVKPRATPVPATAAAPGQRVATIELSSTSNPPVVE